MTCDGRDRAAGRPCLYRHAELDHVVAGVLARLLVLVLAEVCIVAAVIMPEIFTIIPVTFAAAIACELVAAAIACELFADAIACDLVADAITCELVTVDIACELVAVDIACELVAVASGADAIGVLLLGVVYVEPAQDRESIPARPCQTHNQPHTPPPLCRH